MTLEFSVVHESEFWYLLSSREDRAFHGLRTPKISSVFLTFLETLERDFFRVQFKETAHFDLLLYVMT